MKMHFEFRIDNQFIIIRMKNEENIGFGWFIYVCNFQCKHKQQTAMKICVRFVHRASYCV